jgi:transposase
MGLDGPEARRRPSPSAWPERPPPSARLRCERTRPTGHLAPGLPRPTFGQCNKPRIWAVEGCNGIGRHLAQRLVADGETVLDVPAKLSARARLFDTNQARKTDPADAHCIAVAAFGPVGCGRSPSRTPRWALKLLVDRRDSLGRARTEVLNRLHHLLLELVRAGQTFLSAPQARTLLNTMRPATCALCRRGIAT